MRHHNIRLLLVTILLSASAAVSAQELGSAYFTSDYKYRHDLNPAFGNEQNYISLPALGNINVRTQGNFGLGDVLFPNPVTGKTTTTFLSPNISTDEALKGLNSGTNRLQGDVGLTLLSAGFRAFGGYNTVEVSSKTMFGVQLPYELFEFAKNTGNQRYEMDDIRLRAQSYIELALGHSRQIGDRLRVGAKVKMLLGVARADVAIDNLTADLTNSVNPTTGYQQWLVSAQARADMHMKGFSYTTKYSDYETRDGQYPHIDDVDIDGAGIGGFGLAADLGAAYRLTDDLTLSAALTDLGFIRWSNDMVATNEQTTFVFDGFHDLSVREERDPNIFEHQADGYGDQLADFANLRDRGDQGSSTTALAATLRVGAEYVLPVYRPLSFGLLAQHRFFGKYSWTEGRLSANWAPLRWLDGGANVALGTFGASAGWIVNIHPAAFNFFVGMDHILGKQSKELIPLSSNASLNLGMNIAF